MWRHRWSVLAAAILTLSLASAPAYAQRHGGAMMGMGGSMMGMGHDSATMAQMAVFHELILNHDRITRTVTNLPDGIRTVTESDDPQVAQRIKEHVASMSQRVVAADDPGLPIESPALHAIFRNKDKIRTHTDTTAKGIVVVQTSSDPVTAAALQQHASEVTDLVRGGMVAMHDAMMKNGGMMQGGMMQGGMMQGGMMQGGMMQGGMMQGGMLGHASADTVAIARTGHAGRKPDSTFAAMQMRGAMAMGVDQYTSTHKFDTLPDGGRIELQRDVDDSAGVAQIRAHLQGIATAFKSGDFSTPAFVHMRQVPGTEIMAAKRGAISYTFRELPRGGELRIVTKDPGALKAISEFLKFQREDHHAGGMEHPKL
jgi:TusA-related sulfurtransferase